MLLLLSHRVRACHILLPSHGVFQGPEQGLIYRWDSGKDMGLGTKKVIISPAFSSTTRHLSSAEADLSSSVLVERMFWFLIGNGFTETSDQLNECTEIQNVPTS